MCAGLPVVGTAVGGVPELILDGHTGLLVPGRNPEQLANALHILANDPHKRRAMGTAAQVRAESFFTIERSVGAFQGIYAALAQRRVPIYRESRNMSSSLQPRYRPTSTAARRK